MIVYALVGIPMNGFLFAYLGDFFGKVVCMAVLLIFIKKYHKTKNSISIFFSL